MKQHNANNKFTQPNNHSPLEGWVPTEVHDWEGKESNVLVLNYTMSCPLQCDFCCYGCHPKRKEKMPLELALNLIKQAAELGVFSSVGFTGGEPLLYPKEIEIISKELFVHKIPFTIATAAHWAKTKAHASRILTPLKSNGLYRINISCDPSHQKFIPKESVVNAAIVASNLGIPTYVVGTFDSSSQTVDSFAPELKGVRNISLISKYTAAVGRAKNMDITQSNYGLSLGLEELSCYRRIHHDVVVWWDGTVYPCCSTFNRDTSGIVVGNVNSESLRNIWYKLDGSMLIRIMKRKGFYELYEIIKNHDPELYMKLPKAEECVGPCSLCNKIFGSELSISLKQCLEKYEQTKVDKSIDVLCNLVGRKEVMRFLEEIM